ncbi:hypothetical protein [Streptomyces avermitilis]|uniref:hypothetical protein n=1 Tax=Streptomyces avermitilis TaxID=33903 RepID=UPI0036A5AD17
MADCSRLQSRWFNGERRVKGVPAAVRGLLSHSVSAGAASWSVLGQIKLVLRVAE